MVSPRLSAAKRKRDKTDEVIVAETNTDEVIGAETNHDEEIPAKKKKLMPGEYSSKSCFKSHLFGKQSKMLHDIAGNLSKFVVSHPVLKELGKEWYEVCHLINGTDMPEKLIHEMLSTVDQKEYKSYRYLGNKYFKMDVEFLHNLMDIPPEKAFEQFWEYVSAHHLERQKIVHKLMATLVLMFAVQPPKSLAALAFRQKFLTMVLVCLSNGRRIFMIEQFKDVFEKLEFDPSTIYRKKPSDPNSFVYGTKNIGAMKFHQEVEFDKKLKKDFKKDDLKHLKEIYLFSNHDKYEEFKKAAVFAVLRANNVDLQECLEAIEKDDFGKSTPAYKQFFSSRK